MVKGLSEERRLELIETTKEAAQSLVDDIDHIRQLVALDEPSASDIRRISALLRRILVECDLREIANPRIGKIKISCPDLIAYHRASRSPDLVLAVCDPASIFGIDLLGFTAFRGAGENIEHDFDAKVLLDVDQFTSQRVVYFKGRWASRGDIIKYIAHVQNVVHSKRAISAVDQMLHQVRGVVHISLDDTDQGKIPSFSFETAVLEPEVSEVAFDRKRIDLTLYVLISTAQILVADPEVNRLVAIVRREDEAALS